MTSYDEHSEQKRRNAEDKRSKALRSMKNRRFVGAAAHYDTVDVSSYNNAVKNFNYRYLGAGVFMSPAEAKAERVLNKQFIYGESTAELVTAPVEEAPQEPELQTMDKKKKAAVLQM